MYKAVKRVIKNCELCQKTKCSKKPKQPLEPITDAEKNDLLAVDFFGPLSTSRRGVNYIFVIMDVFTKYDF